MRLTDEQRNKLIQDYNVYSTDEKGNSHLILPNLAELIYHGLGYHFLTTKDSGEIYYYNGGYFESKGEQPIKNETEQFLKDGTKEHSKNEVVGHIRDKNYQSRDIFNVPINLINLKNGVFNIDTDELLEHSPDYHFLNEIPIVYDPNADCPKIMKFLKEILYPEDIPVIQEFAGYSLYRRCMIHRACMFLGGGKNGKSTFIKLLIKFLGERNVANKELQELSNQLFARDSLFGKLLNTASELSDQAVNQTGLFKQLTGEDRIDANKKFKDSYQFTNYAKLLFSANKLPKTNDESYAYYRRWILISFPNTFDGKNCDPYILEKLATPEELSGFFNWSIEGLKRLLANGDFSYSKTVDEVMEQYKTMSDPVYAFCTEYVKKAEPNDPKYIIKEEFREKYIKWSRKLKLPITPPNMLTQQLQNILPDIRVGKSGAKGKQKPAYINITWRNKEENPQTDLFNSDTNLTGEKP
jgi:putative DNA primase/helicase